MCKHVAPCVPGYLCVFLSVSACVFVRLHLSTRSFLIVTASATAFACLSRIQHHTHCNCSAHVFSASTVAIGNSNNNIFYAAVSSMAKQPKADEAARTLTHTHTRDAGKRWQSHHDERMEGRTDGRTDQRTNGWTNKPTGEERLRTATVIDNEDILGTSVTWQETSVCLAERRICSAAGDCCMHRRSEARRCQGRAREGQGKELPNTHRHSPLKRMHLLMAKIISADEELTSGRNSARKH